MTTANKIIAKINGLGKTCNDGCTATLRFGVHESAAGSYLGYWCPECGPFDRQSGYFPSKEAALYYLENHVSAYIDD